MRFPNLESVALPATFESLMQGRLHRDGQRYLPLIVLRTRDQTLLGVVDRHHRIQQRHAGQAGTARLVFHLSRVRLQPAGVERQGFDPESADPDMPATAPAAYGRIVAIPTWEQHRKLGYDSLYTELLLDVGLGVVGLRTNITGDRLADVLGADQLQIGDWIEVARSRIDILEFVPDN